MSVKALCIKGYWTVRANWRKLRCSHRVTPNTEQRAREVAEAFQMALKLYGKDAFKMFDQPTEEVKDPETVKSFAARWLAEINKGDLKLSTRKMYKSNLEIHILPALGSLQLGDLDYGKVKTFLLSKRDATYSTGRFRKRKYRKSAHDKAYSRDSIRIMAMTLRAMLTEACREKLISENPVSDLAQFYRKKKQDRTVTRNQVYTLEQLYSIEDQFKVSTLYGDDYELSILMSRTGMRIGEALAVEWSDINWIDNQIRISRNIPSGTGKSEDSPKTDAGLRLVDMSQELREALQALRARRGAEKLKSRIRGRARISSTRYEQFHEDWKRAQRTAKVHYLSPHSIRHTYASQMLAAGCDIAWLSKQLGHSSPAVTLSIYSHFIPGKKQQAVNALDRKSANEMQITTPPQQGEIKNANKVQIVKKR
jgi:integrase